MKTTTTTLLAMLLSASPAFLGCAAESTEEPVAATNEDALVAAAPLGPDPRGEATRYPIILAHGFLGSRDGLASFNDAIPEALAADGHRVYRSEVPPLGTVNARARVLAREVDKVLRETGAKKVNIVAHSMGGLDARELVSTLGYGDRVASVTTISTPHRGSRIADVGLALVGEALEAFAGLSGKSRDDVANDVNIRGALRDLSEANAPEWNDAHPDDARVYYQSWAGVSSIFAIPNPADAAACDGKLLAHRGRADSMGIIVAPAAPIVAHGMSSNDGFVLVSSAKWGNFRGCVPADHADEIGFLRLGTMDRHTGFDFVRFHRNVAFDLARRGL